MAYRARVHLMPWAPQDMRSSRVRSRSFATQDPLLRLVYRELLDSLWEHGGELPYDLEYLADDLMLPRAEVERAVLILLTIPGALVASDQGTLLNERVQRDLSEEAAYRHSQALKGALGGRNRWRAEEAARIAAAKPAPASGQAGAKQRLGSGQAAVKQRDSKVKPLDGHPLPSSLNPTSPVPSSVLRTVVPPNESSNGSTAVEEPGASGGTVFSAEALLGSVPEENEPSVEGESSSKGDPARAGDLAGGGQEGPTEGGGATVPEAPQASAPSRPRRGQEHRAVEVALRDFGTWWELYPKKVGKGEAEAYWLAMPAVDRDAALAAVPAFATAWRGAASDRLAYLIYPVRWLKRRHWSDDPAEWYRSAGKLPPHTPAPITPAQERGLVGAHPPAAPGRRDEDDPTTPTWVRSVMRHVRTDGDYTEEQLSAVLAWKAGDNPSPPAPYDQPSAT